MLFLFFGFLFQANRFAVAVVGFSVFIRLIGRNMCCYRGSGFEKLEKEEKRK